MISVCLATYNGEKYIKAQIESILCQLTTNDEIIISDDGSTDDTLKVLNDFNDSRIKIYFNQGERGYTRNFENSIKNATGKYIFLSDQDDIWCEGKIDKMIFCLETHALVTSDAQFVDENLSELDMTFFQFRGGRSGFLTNLIKSQYLGACLAFRSDILKKLLPFPSNSELCPHDLWISLVAEFYYKVKVINEPLIKYRRHQSNVSTGGLRSTNSIFRKIEFRAYSFFQILLRIRK